MNAAMRWVVWGSIPLGTLIGGSIGQTVGLHFALWVGAIGALPAFLFVLLSPVRAIQAIPDEAAESTNAEIESAFLDLAPMSPAKA
jgi:hypothetical protein